MSDADRLDELDRWLSSYSTEPWSLSGLPGLFELSQPYSEDDSWTSSARSKQYWRVRKGHLKNRISKRNSQFPLSSHEFSLVDDFAQSLFAGPAPATDSFGSLPASRNDLTSVGEGTCPSDRCYSDPAKRPDRVDSVVDDPSSRNNGDESAEVEPAVQKPLKPSESPFCKLRSFQFSHGFPKRSSCFIPRSSRCVERNSHRAICFPISLEVSLRLATRFLLAIWIFFSGKKGVAKQVANRGNTWSLTFEIEDNPSQDLNNPSNRLLIQRLLDLKAVHTLGAAITCRSFSRAVRPPVRTRTEPKGLPNLSPNMEKKVAEGNDQACWLAGLVSVCILNSIFFWVENPDLSYLWWLPEWRRLGAFIPSNSFRIDYCTCGCPWKKRTRVFTNLWLRDRCLFCNKGHKHIRLVGWSKEYGLPWTRLAQEYPRRFCGLLADAILLDTGLIPFRRRMDVAGMAKQTNRRIGEASNPGPRRRSGRSRRNLGLLVQTDLVEPQTALLGEKVWKSFRLWSLGKLSSEAFDVFVQ